MVVKTVKINNPDLNKYIHRSFLKPMDKIKSITVKFEDYATCDECEHNYPTYGGESSCNIEGCKFQLKRDLLQVHMDEIINCV